MGAASEKVIDYYRRYVMNTYARDALVVTKGKGSRVWDLEGREYLDLFPGWGVSGLGYNHPWVMGALRGQSRRLAHVSNNYYQPLQWRAAKKLTEVSFPGKVFFCNSGAETVETGIKLARRWGEGRYELVVMEGSFHGRTMAALSATGQPKYQEGFAPLLPGFVHAPFNDIEAVKAAVGPRTCAVMLEPIQGEGGVHVAGDDFLRDIRRLCDEHGILMILDEVQTGMGRTGQWFAYQHSGIEPDVLLISKALGGGFPIGAVVARDEVASGLTPGTHASTFGGNPLGCACILAVFEAIEKQGLIQRVNSLSAAVFEKLGDMQKANLGIVDVRGRGFMIGMELSKGAKPVVDECRERGVLINCTQGNVLRLLPAMTISKVQLERGLSVIEEALRAVFSKTSLVI